MTLSLITACLLLLSGSILSNSLYHFSGNSVSAAEPPPRAEEHPFAIVALASLDRVKARAMSLGEAIGEPEFGRKLMAVGFVGDASIGRILDSPGFDTTRPIGIMSFPNWFDDAPSDDEENGADNQPAANGKASANNAPKASWLSDLMEDPFQFLASAIMENSTMAICIPARDRDRLLADISKLADETFIPIAGRPGAFEGQGDADTKILFVGRYLMIIAEDGQNKRWDRNYPDFERLARTSLGQSGFAYSLFRRGLPKLVRDEMLEPLKQTFAATLQRYDNETEADFKTRTAFGPLMTDSLDLLLSHIEEFRITGHVDSTTHQVLVDTELIGPKDGKLAKFTNAMAGKSSVFGAIPTDDAVFAAHVSTTLDRKRWQPVADTLIRLADLAALLPGVPDVLRTFAKSIDAGQLEFHASYTRNGQGLLAIRTATNAAFPEQLGTALQTYVKLFDDALHVGTIKVAIDSVEGLPVHRIRAHILDGIEFDDVGFQNLTPNNPRPTAKGTMTSKGADGKTIVSEIEMSVPPGEDVPQNFLWAVATPNGVWLALSTPEKHELPDWCRAAIVASLAKPAAAATTRNPATARFLLRGLGGSPAAKETPVDNSELAQILQAADQEVQDLNRAIAAKPAPNDPKRKPPTAEQLAAEAAAREVARLNEKHSHERGEALRDGSNAIQAEVRPTATGLRIRTTLDNAYFQWFALFLKHSHEESEARPQERIAPADVSQPETPGK